MTDERLFQERWVELAQQIGGFAAQFRPSNVRTMKVRVGKGMVMTFVQRAKHVRSELYIYRGKDIFHESEAIYDQFFSNREAIEADFDEPLEWNPRGGNACRIERNFHGFDLKDPHCWDEFCIDSINAMNRLHAALVAHF